MAYKSTSNKVKINYLKKSPLIPYYSVDNIIV